jgi:ribose/xylose/arabinose/galactoside ABC-type transport system permease subunit
MSAVNMHAILKLIKNTHRHPANQALHFIGAPFYVAGLAVVLGHFAGILQQQTTTTTELVAGTAMWLAAIAMFVLGHKIEGNIGSMTPVLLFRLMSRKVARYSVAQRVHLLWV